MSKNESPILVTGAAGFIGYSLVRELLLRGENVIGIDNLNDYYDLHLKNSRIKEINILSDKNNSYWKFYKISINNFIDLKELFALHQPKIVINLAAQAGVRYSLKNPESYIESNLIGFYNILENCKNHKIKNLIYASSSSVYGGNRKLPYAEKDAVNHPISLYAVTKKSNELMAHSYSHLYGIPTTGLRFFTVYGPWGRPDMAPMIFSKSILEGSPIDVFNYGDMARDFTFIDDVVEAICRCCKKPAKIDKHFNQSMPNPSTSFAPYRLFNVGSNRPIKLLKFIELLEINLDKKAVLNFKELQDGDVIETSSDSSLLGDWINFKPKVKIDTGLKIFVRWFRNYYKYEG